MNNNEQRKKELVTSFSICLAQSLETAVMAMASREGLSRSAMFTKIVASYLGLPVDYWLRDKSKCQPRTHASVQLTADPAIFAIPYDYNELCRKPRRAMSVYASILTPGFKFGNGDAVGELRYPDGTPLENNPELTSNILKAIHEQSKLHGIPMHHLKVEE